MATAITTWDNDGLKLTVTVPIGTGYPVSTLSGTTLTAFIGTVFPSGSVSGAVAATSVSYTETSTLATIIAFWSAASVAYGPGKRTQVIIDVPGDKKYTIFDATLNVSASLG